MTEASLRISNALLARDLLHHFPLRCPYNAGSANSVVASHIRVASHQELKDHIMAAIDHFNQSLVVHTWSYKLDKAA